MAASAIADEPAYLEFPSRGFEEETGPVTERLFRSAAQVYGQRVIGVLLSGMLDDGVEGLKEIKRHGGLAIVQDPAGAGFPAMPQNALAKVEVDYCLPVTKIRDLMTRLPGLPRMPMGKSHGLPSAP